MMQTFTSFPALCTGCMLFKVGKRLHFSRALHRLHVFQGWQTFTSFPALDTGCMFLKASKRLLFFPRFSPVACFSRLANVYIFSRAFHRLHVSQGWQTFTSFPALFTGCMFLKAGKRLHLFPRFSPVACFSMMQTFKSFPALCTGCMFLKVGQCWHLFPRFAPVVCFSRLANVYIFSRAFHRLHVFQGWPTFHLFPRLALVACSLRQEKFTSFSALFTGCMLFKTGKRLHFYRPRFATVALDAALGASFTFWFLAQFYLPWLVPCDKFCSCLRHSVETTLTIESM